MTSKQVPEKIMVCVDGSEIGYRAADFAIALAEKLDSKILFVNVVGASTSEQSYSISADMVGSFETLGKEALSKCEALALKSGVDYETQELAGDPAEEILKKVSKSNCDCIVIGKKGLGKIEKMIMGSVSDKVVKLSEVPVIIVK